MSSAEGSITTFSYATANEIIAAGAVLPFIAAIFIILRFYCRHLQRVGLGIDDWLLIPAWFMILGMGIGLIVGAAKKSLGYPTPAPTTNDTETLLNQLTPALVIAQKIQFAVTLFMLFAYCLIKFSILFLYKRIFVGNMSKDNVFNYLLITTMAIVIAWTIGFFFLTLFACGTHVASKWGSRAQLVADCPHTFANEEALFVSEFITNVIILILPLPRVWKLHMPTSRKIAVSGILLLAFAAFAASIARLVLLLEVTTSSITSHFDEDQTISTIYYWSIIEAALALTASCLPTLPPLLRQRSIRSVVESARSAISLHSIRSRPSKNSNDSKDGKVKSYKMIYDGQIDKSGASDADMIRALEGTNAVSETHVMHDISAPESAHMEGPGRSINVQHEFGSQEQYHGERAAI